MDKYELLERYEALGEEDDFVEGKRLFEQQMNERSSALDRRQYGYLLECHGRYTMRFAVEQYERAMSLDPDDEKVQYQWISAKAALGEADDAITRYGGQVSRYPGNVRDVRLLSRAFLVAHDFRAASEIIDAGLELAPEDCNLLSDRGEVKEALGDPEGALADWRRALELCPDYLGPAYASAFLHEKQGELTAAERSWRHIIEHAEARGWELTADWPRRELRRLRDQLGKHPDHEG